MHQTSPSPRHSNGRGSSPLPPCPGGDRRDSYPRRAPSSSQARSGTSTPRGTFPQMPSSCSASEYASCDEQMPSFHHGGGGGGHSGHQTSSPGMNNGSFDLPMPPSPASRENNSSGEGSRRSKQIFMQRTTYSTSVSGEKRKDMMTWSYVSSESDSSRPNSNSQPSRQSSKSQGSRPPNPATEQRGRPSTYSEGLSGPPRACSSQRPSGGPPLTNDMEVIYNRENCDSDSDFSFCDVAEQEPDRPSTAVLFQQQQQLQAALFGSNSNASGGGVPPPTTTTTVPGGLQTGGGASSLLLPSVLSGRGANPGQEAGGGSGRGANAPSFATRYRGTVKSYSKQNQNSVGKQQQQRVGGGDSPRKPQLQVQGKKVVTSSRKDGPRKLHSNTTGRRKPTTTVNKTKLARQHLFDDEEDSSDAFNSSSSFDSSEGEGGYETPMEPVEGMAQ